MGVAYPTMRWATAMMIVVVSAALLVVVHAHTATQRTPIPLQTQTQPTPTPTQPRALVIDSDLGDDDVAAINLLFGAASSSASDCAPLGITTVFGVCSMLNATSYALGIEQAFMVPLLNQSTDVVMNPWPLVPISSGAATFLPGGAYMPWQDSTGPISAIPTKIHLRTSPTSAVSHLLEMADKHRGSLVILAIGPLTNIAQAILEGGDRFTSAVSQIVIMGGAVYVPGNTHNKLAEWNIRADPEAANIVFSSNISSKLLVPMDATDYAKCTTTLSGIITMPTSRTVPGLMIQQAVERICTTWSDPELYDPVAAAILLNPLIATRRESLPLRVVTQGAFAIGRTVVDRDRGSMLDVVLAINPIAFGFTVRDVAQRQTWWPAT